MSAVCLIPPILVLLCALKTRKVIFSLIVGLLSASFIAQDYQVVEGLKFAVMSVSNTLDIPALLSGKLPPSDSYWTLFAFITALGITIVLLQKTGAAQAFSQLIERKVKKKKDIESMSLLLSCLFFIDDYFSSLSIGTLMHPITDRYRITRAKLAFLIDSMAAPLAILCPFSTWVGVVIGFLQSNGINEEVGKNTVIIASPFWVFVQIIPFVFYSFIIMAGSWLIVRKEISFGSMRQFEEYTLKTGDSLGNPKNETVSEVKLTKTAGVRDFFVIWVTLISSLFGSMLYYGKWASFGGERSFMQALQNTEITMALLTAGFIAVSISSLYFLLRGVLHLKMMPQILNEGSQLMRSAILILILAWSMGSILREDLQVGHYIAGNVLNHVSPAFLPFTVFLVGALIAFATGSSWGTSALLFPMIIPTIVILSVGDQAPVPLEQVPLFLPTIGALLSGCVAGDHISPISDTTIMTSLSTDMRHIDHVKTQLNYALPCIACTGFAFALFGIFAEYPLWIQTLISIMSGIAAVITLLFTLNALGKKRELPPLEVCSVSTPR